MLNWITVERVKRNLSREELAKALGISRHAIAALETGRYQANVEFATLLSRYFNKRVEDIFFVSKRMCRISEIQLKRINYKK